MRYRSRQTGMLSVSRSYSLNSRRWDDWIPGYTGASFNNNVVDTTTLPSRNEVIYDDASTSDRFRTLSALKPSSGYTVKTLKKSYHAKPCRHVRSQIKAEPIETGFRIRQQVNSHVYNDIALTGSGWAFLHYEVGVGPSFLTNGTPVNSPPSAINDIPYDEVYLAYQESLNSMTGQEMLLGEFLAEPGIIVSAIKAVASPSRVVRDFIRWAARPTIASRKMSLKGGIHHYSKGLASTNLGYQFGVKPLIDDLSSIVSANRKVDKSTDFFRRHRGAWVHFGAGDQVVSPAGTLPSMSSFPYTTAVVGYMPETVDVRMGCEGRVVTDESRFSAWRAYRDYFRLDRVLSLGWELIPLSFMVDWFTNAQDIVDTISRRKDPVFSELRNFCVSTKRTGGRGFYFYPKAWRYMTSGYTLGFSEPIICASDSTTDYIRSLSFQSSTQSRISFEKLGLWHLITAGSVLVQKHK